MIWALMFSQLAIGHSIVRSVYTLPKMVVLALILVVMAWRPGRRGGQPWIWYAFLAAFAVSTYYSFAWSMSLNGIYLSGAETVLLATICFLAYRAAQAGRVEDALEAGAAAASIAVVMSAFMATQDGRWSGITGQAARFGTTLAMGAAMAMSGRRWASALPLILIGVVMTGSRGAILAVLVAYAYLHRGKVPWWAWTAALAALAAAVALRGIGAASDAMRIDQARAGWEVFLANPWVGCGPATFLPVAPKVNQFHTHILPLNVLATQGLLGAAAWSWLAWDAWRAAGREVRAVYVAAGVCSMFNPLPGLAYVWMAVLYGASRRGPERERRDWPRLIVAHAVMAVILVMVAADRHAELAERGGPTAAYHWSRARALNPLEFYYFAKTYKRPVPSGAR